MNNVLRVQRLLSLFTNLPEEKFKENEKKSVSEMAAFQVPDYVGTTEERQTYFIPNN